MRQFLIQMSGAPGSGKSTVGGLLAKSLNGVVINHDLMKSFFLEQGHSFTQSAQLTYPLQWVLAEDLIKQGRSVIIDSCCNYQEILDNGIALANKYGFEYKHVECKVGGDLELLEKRMKARAGMRSQRTGIDSAPIDAGEAVVSGESLFKKWLENPFKPEGGIVVDSRMGPEECLASVLKAIYDEPVKEHEVTA